MFNDIVKKKIPHWSDQNNFILVDRDILKELNELREIKKENDGRMGRQGRYLLTLEKNIQILMGQIKEKDLLIDEAKSLLEEASDEIKKLRQELHNV